MRACAPVSSYACVCVLVNFCKHLRLGLDSYEDCKRGHFKYLELSSISRRFKAEAFDIHVCMYLWAHVLA